MLPTGYIGRDLAAFRYMEGVAGAREQPAVVKAIMGASGIWMGSVGCAGGRAGGTAEVGNGYLRERARRGERRGTLSGALTGGGCARLLGASGRTRGGPGTRRSWDGTGAGAGSLQACQLALHRTLALIIAQPHSLRYGHPGRRCQPLHRAARYRHWSTNRARLRDRP